MVLGDVRSCARRFNRLDRLAWRQTSQPGRDRLAPVARGRVFGEQCFVCGVCIRRFVGHGVSVDCRSAARSTDCSRCTVFRQAFDPDRLGFVDADGDRAGFAVAQSIDRNFARKTFLARMVRSSGTCREFVAWRIWPRTTFDFHARWSFVWCCDATSCFGNSSSRLARACWSRQWRHDRASWRHFDRGRIGRFE